MQAPDLDSGFRFIEANLRNPEFQKKLDNTPRFNGVISEEYFQAKQFYINTTEQSISSQSQATKSLSSYVEDLPKIITKIQKVDFSKDQDTEIKIQQSLANIAVFYREIKAAIVEATDFCEDLITKLLRYDAELFNLLELIWQNGEYGKMRKFSYVVKANLHSQDSWGNKHNLLGTLLDYSFAIREKILCHIPETQFINALQAAPKITYTQFEQMQEPSVAEEIVDYDHTDPFPESPQILDRFAGTADQVFDTFGALTYAKNPLHALIYAARLLKPCGKFSTVSSGKPSVVDGSVLGNAITRAKIKKFFQDFFAIDLTFNATRVESQVTPGAVWDDWHISFTAPGEFKAIGYEESIQENFAQADAIIGVPKPVVEVTNTPGQFSDFAINMLEYEQEDVANIFADDERMIRGI